jgi:hypothetical protein
MPANRVSRRDFLTSAAAASAGIRLASAGQSASPSTELLVLMERLLVARTERDRLHEIVVAVERNRPESIRDPYYGLLHVHSRRALQLGMRDLAEVARVFEASVEGADSENDIDRHNDALEAAESVVCDIEASMVDFEPRSIADLRLQVELALHQEVLDYGMDDRLPRLICERFLRLIPASAALI